MVREDTARNVSMPVIIASFCDESLLRSERSKFVACELPALVAFAPLKVTDWCGSTEYTYINSSPLWIVQRATAIMYT